MRRLETTRNEALWIGELGPPYEFASPCAGEEFVELIGNDDPADRMGNLVSIDHGNGEFSVLGHLQQGSVRVAAGDRGGRGQVLGLAGNSGNSNGPHLHYNLQDRAEPNRGKGLPAQFTDFDADGRFVPRGEPVQGQRIGRR